MYFGSVPMGPFVLIFALVWGKAPSWGRACSKNMSELGALPHFRAIFVYNVHSFYAQTSAGGFGSAVLKYLVLYACERLICFPFVFRCRVG